MLPEIVRAAAEPLGHIESLTVLSSEGASDVVKTTTRTLAEASASVKGLTGIDIPELLNNALGGSEPKPQPPATAATEAPDRRRSGGRWAGRGRGHAPCRVTRVRRLRAAGERRRTRRRRAPPPRRRAPRHRHPPRTASADPRGSASRRRRRPWRPRRRGRRPPRRTPWAASSRRCRPCPRRATCAPATRAGWPTAAAAAVGLDESSTLSDSATRLAEELIRIPGIERFGGTRLRDLDRSGPRSLRVLWGAARDELSSRYGEVTIGTLLDAYTKR